MRHGKKFNHLGRTADHRRAMLANMARPGRSRLRECGRRDWRLAGLSSALAFPLDLGARPLCRRLRGRGCANCQSLPQAELFVRQRERPGLPSQALAWPPRLSIGLCVSAACLLITVLFQQSLHGWLSHLQSLISLTRNRIGKSEKQLL